MAHGFELKDRCSTVNHQGIASRAPAWVANTDNFLDAHEDHEPAASAFPPSAFGICMRLLTSAPGQSRLGFSDPQPRLYDVPCPLRSKCRVWDGRWKKAALWAGS